MELPTCHKTHTSTQASMSVGGLSWQVEKQGISPHGASPLFGTQSLTTCGGSPPSFPSLRGGLVTKNGRKMVQHLWPAETSCVFIKLPEGGIWYLLSRVPPCLYGLLGCRCKRESQTSTSWRRRGARQQVLAVVTSVAVKGIQMAMEGGCISSGPFLLFLAVSAAPFQGRALCQALLPTRPWWMEPVQLRSFLWQCVCCLPIDLNTLSVTSTQCEGHLPAFVYSTV